MDSPASRHVQRIDAYNASVEPLNLSQRGQLHQLTVGVLWPHRDNDLDLFLSLGKGYLAIDEIGRPVGSAMFFPMSDNFAMLGMMVTVPRLQAHGAGKWLLECIMADCAGRDLRLITTHSGYRLYAAAGFTPIGLVRQHQGIAQVVSAPQLLGLDVREMGQDDAVALRAVDTAAYGAARPEVLDALMRLSTGRVAVRGGVVVGYALHRPFGKGMVIGPVVAEDDAMAMQLVAPLITANAGRFSRLDTPADSRAFTSFLTAAGLVGYDTLTEMRVGPHRRATTGAMSYGLASQSLG